MKAKTEELLHMVFWACDTYLHPSFRYLDESFESWAYRHGLLRQVQRLEARKWLEHEEDEKGDRLHRLTEAGRLQALGGRDPDACWRRRWDGLWRLALFDVPEARSGTRNRLRRYLRSRGFGYLQNSVWITPDALELERNLLSDDPVDVESLLLLEARPGAGESDEEIVAGAWDFDRINELYEKHREILTRRPRRRIGTEAAAKAFRAWLGREREAWKEVMERDPLLPEVLLPPGYAGREAWARRLSILREAGQQMRQFKLAGSRDNK
ncbi:MAG TPA: PaaX family transcriptional regulator C-terminal domain-containing protein [Methylomirabilota bacterium]|nr:PaaX family transcriptional regulator C-terminal domain-containing protein [Methylomirabilota bacterium]